MQNISIVLERLTSDHPQRPSLTAQLVECYREVFADAPWNEWMKCPQCQKYWGRKDAGILAHQLFRCCDVPLIDFWARDQVATDFKISLEDECSLCWLAMDGEKVIGFCLGKMKVAHDLEKELGISFAEKFDFITEHGPVAYQDELGVLSAYRGCKIAKALFVRRLDDFLLLARKVSIVRTRQFPEPSQTFQWYTQKLGYKILATYPGDDGRVILGRPLAGLKELLSK